MTILAMTIAIAIVTAIIVTNRNHNDTQNSSLTSNVNVFY